MTKNTITNAQALALAIELAKGANNNELATKLAKMLETATKPRTKKEGPTKAHKENVKLLEEVMEFIKGNSNPVTAKEVANNVAGIGTVQKAVVVLKIGIANGTVEKIKVGSQTLYTIAE